MLDFERLILGSSPWIFCFLSKSNDMSFDSFVVLFKALNTLLINFQNYENISISLIMLQANWQTKKVPTKDGPQLSYNKLRLAARNRDKPGWATMSHDQMWINKTLEMLLTRIDIFQGLEARCKLIFHGFFTPPKFHYVIVWQAHNLLVARKIPVGPNLVY